MGMGMEIVKELGWGWEGMGIECMGMGGNGNVKKPFSPISTSYPLPVLDNIRVMVIVCRLRENIIRTDVCWIV